MRSELYIIKKKVPGLSYAFTENGVELPVLDITHPPDGKYFFYTSGKNGSEDIFWVSTKIIVEISLKENKKYSPIIKSK